MSTNTPLPASIATALSPTLPAPALAIDGIENAVIDDVIIDALIDSPGIPFTVPFYADVAVGDFIVLLGNGRTVTWHQVTRDELQLGEPFTLHVPLEFFTFTGKVDLYYYQEDTHAPPNHAVSGHLILKVHRNNYPAPYAEGEDTLPAPAISPSLYNKQSFDNNENVSVTVSYATMAEGDTLQLAMEIRATTADRSANFYYPDPSPPAQNVDQKTASTRALQFTLPASSFKGIDESITRVFYTVYPSDKPWLQQRSLSTVFQVDDVPPFS